MMKFACFGFLGGDMNIRFKHTNIVASDWRKLASFYSGVFQCVVLPPERHLSGDWLAQGTGVEGASFSGSISCFPAAGTTAPPSKFINITTI